MLILNNEQDQPKDYEERKKFLKIDNIVMVAVIKTFAVLKNFCSDYFAVRRKSWIILGKTIRNLSTVIYCMYYLYLC